MLTEIHKARSCGMVVMETEEAMLLCMGKKFFDNHTGQEVKPGEYLAVEKASTCDIFGADVYKSTKGNYRRAMKAFERYSPLFWKEMKETADMFPCRIEKTN